MTSTTTRIITIALATLAVAAPTAIAKPVGGDGDFRTSSPVATDSAPRQDLRNPGNRTVEAALAQERYYSYHGAGPAQDVRSTDTQTDVISPQVFTDRQRANIDRFKRSTSYQKALREAIVANLPQPAPLHSDGGIDWDDAGIGAAGMLALTLLAIGGTVAVNRRRHTLAGAAATTR